MKTPEYVEGPEAADRFNALVRKVLAVPVAVVRERHMQATFERSMEQKRRGPKPKRRVSRVPGAA